MGRFKPREEAIIREFDELTVIILYRDTIWIVPKRASCNIIFHRWFSPPLGSFPDWHKFRKKLIENKHITLDDCYRWARTHQIQSQGTTRAPTLNGQPLLKPATIAKNNRRQK